MSERTSDQHRYLHAVLRPVIRYCLRNNIKLQEVVESCKEQFVNEAETTMQTQGIEASSSRVAVITGVHRKDVARLRSVNPPIKRSGDISARVLNSWESNPRFTTATGSPKLLSFEGAASDFATLVRSVSQELNPYTVLFDLERANAVERTPRGLRRKMATYLPVQNIEQGLSFLETDTEDLLCAVEENLFHDAHPKNLHIKTEYDNIPASCAGSIKQWLLELGDQFHAQARRYLAELDSANSTATPSEPTIRVAVATFSRVEPTISTTLEPASTS